MTEVEKLQKELDNTIATLDETMESAALLQETIESLFAAIEALNG